MSTPFTMVYPVQRTLLGDVGASPLYSTAQLDMGIRTGLLEDATMQGGMVWGGTPSVAPPFKYSEDLTNPGNIIPNFPRGSDGVNLTVQGQVDFFRIAIRGTLALVDPTLGIKRTKTPVTEINRNQAELIAGLRQKLVLCTQENVVAGGQSDTDNWLFGYLNFLAKMQGRI